MTVSWLSFLLCVTIVLLDGVYLYLKTGKGNQHQSPGSNYFRTMWCGFRKARSRVHIFLQERYNKTTTVRIVMEISLLEKKCRKGR